jgi:hypothetical protein
LKSTVTTKINALLASSFCAAAFEMGNTVARSQHRLSANFGKKFGQMRKNSAFFQKYVLQL